MIARRSLVAAIGTVALALLLAPPALATFHEMMIREVYPGSGASPNSEYVELQMWAPGQNFVGGHQISSTAQRDRSWEPLPSPMT